MTSRLLAAAALPLLLLGWQGQGTAGQGGATPRPEPDLLTLAEGAVLVETSANPNAALALIDGSAKSGWVNAGKREAAPYRFVFELRAPTTIDRVGIAGAGKRPGGAAGASARSVTVEASSEGRDRGFRQIAAFDAAEEGNTLVPVRDKAPVRWLRFTIASNHGNAIWTYLNEAIVQGRQAAPGAVSFAGVFQTGRADFVELKQQGGALTGCYTEQAGHTVGTMNGQVDQGVARVAWISDEGVKGTALFAMDSQGRLNGVRYRDKSRNVWSGGKAPAGTKTPCSQAQAPANPVAAALEKDGRALIYGILFDFDKATLKPESRAALEQLLAALTASPGLALTIEGHTDSDGDDAYNLALSRQRAQAVVAWLVERRVAAGRLTAVGKGEASPVASNDTADGRALNRRVEAVRR